MKHTTFTHTGFTLVEMLVVIAIIGILAALMSGAMVAVKARVQKTAISSELKQLEMALEAYKTTYGEYPPDGTDPDAVKRHLAKAFPRATGISVDVKPENALVFWLGGPIYEGTPKGFCKNPKNPDLTGGSANPRTTPFFDFSQSQLEINGIYAKYVAKTGGGPYVYFRGKVSGGTTTYSGSYSDATYGSITPYKKGSGNNWYGERKFQIISPGLDGKYGTCKEGDITTANVDAFDNQTNFGDIEDLAE